MHIKRNDMNKKISSHSLFDYVINMLLLASSLSILSLKLHNHGSMGATGILYTKHLITLAQEWIITSSVG